jgi:hypothetical protein
MKWYWKNNGEPDENGDIEIVIENDEGRRVSNFKGKTKDEVIIGLANSQVQANRRLGELLKPDKAQPPPEPVVSEADRVRLSSGVTDPSRVVETVTEIVTRQKRTQEEQDEYDRTEAEAFVAATPEYYPSMFNQRALFKALMKHKYDLTRNNLAIVYQELTDLGLLETEPEDNEEEAPVTAPSGRDRGSTAVAEMPSPVSRATGLRNSDASASRPAPPKKKPTITRAELERMTRQEYNERLRDPEFRRAVDALA